MARLISIVIILAVCPAALTTWAAAPVYYACMGACTSGAAAGGLMGGVCTGGVAAGGAMLYGAAACAYVCGAPSGLAVAVSGGFLCFGDGAQVHLPDGSTIAAERVSEGNVTLAMDMKGDVSRTRAKVVYAKREEGSFGGRKFVFGQNGKTITVTDNHLMFLEANGTVELREAQDVMVGDFLLPAAGHDGSSHPFQVVAAEAVVMGARNIIATSEGTISVEGLTVSAMCDAPAEGTHASEAFWAVLQGYGAADVVQLWKAGHVKEELVL